MRLCAGAYCASPNPLQPNRKVECNDIKSALSLKNYIFLLVFEEFALITAIYFSVITFCHQWEIAQIQKAERLARWGFGQF